MRQKQHFAKARTKLKTKRSPQFPPFISTAAPITHCSRSIGSSQSVSGKVLKNQSRPQLAGRKRPMSPGKEQHLDALTNSRFFGTFLGAYDAGTWRLDENDHPDLALMQKRQRILSTADWAYTGSQKQIAVRVSQGSSCKRQWRRKAHSKIKSGNGIHRSTDDLLQEYRQRLDKIITSPQTEGVRVCIGSQEQRWGESSSSSHHHTKHGSPPATNPHFYDDLVSFPVDSEMVNCSEQTWWPSIDRARHILTSSPLILQPVPLRRAPTSFLRLISSSDLDDSQDTRVKPGYRASSVASSMKDKNEDWKRWVESFNNDDEMTISATELTQTSCTKTQQISIGVSERVCPYGLSRNSTAGLGTDLGFEVLGSADLRAETRTATRSPPQHRSLSVIHETFEEYGYFPLQSDCPTTENPGGTSETTPSDSEHMFSTVLQSVDPMWAKVYGINAEFIEHSKLESQDVSCTITTGNSATRVASTVEETTLAGEFAHSLPSKGARPTEEDIMGRHHFVDSTEALPTTMTTTTTCEATQGLEIEAENEEWRKFVYGESRKDEQDFAGTAYNAASHEVVGALHPSDSFSDAPSDQWDVNISTLDSSRDNINSLARAPGPLPEHVSSPQTAASHQATLGSSNTLTSDMSGNGVDSLSMSDSFEANRASADKWMAELGAKSQTHIHQWNDGSSENCRYFPHPTTTGNFPDPGSTAVEPSRSSAPGNTAGLKFAPPKLFVGKLSGSAKPGCDGKAAPLRATPVKRKPRTVRMKGKRAIARDGRTDIRALPDYSGDPIEDFVDENSDGPRSSLFARLEME
jgi:hypothetical protein